MDFLFTMAQAGSVKDHPKPCIGAGLELAEPAADIRASSDLDISSAISLEDVEICSSHSAPIFKAIEAVAVAVDLVITLVVHAGVDLGVGVIAVFASELGQVAVAGVIAG